MDMDIAVALGIITAVAGKLLFALIAYFIGRVIVDAIVKAVGKLSAMEKVEPTARTFILSFVRIGLYIVLLVTIIGILGVPMASVVAVLASAGVTVGLALQGALANLAGGLMLMFFKPFSVGDFVEAAGVAGVVKEVTMFYTTIMTTDNRRVTVPNGSLMNANVTNYSSQKLRRVDLTFACAKSEAPANIQNIMQGVMAKHDKVLKAPEADAPCESVRRNHRGNGIYGLCVVQARDFLGCLVGFGPGDHRGPRRRRRPGSGSPDRQVRKTRQCPAPAGKQCSRHRPGSSTAGIGRHSRIQNSTAWLPHTETGFRTARMRQSICFATHVLLDKRGSVVHCRERQFLLKSQ